jgi:hypothetical protein
MDLFLLARLLKFLFARPTSHAAGTLINIIGSLLTAIKTAPAAPDAPDSGRFVDEVGNVGPRQAEGELFPAQAETVDPFVVWR